MSVDVTNLNLRRMISWTFILAAAVALEFTPKAANHRLPTFSIHRDIRVRAQQIQVW
jgi:hypothetical protein